MTLRALCAPLALAVLALAARPSAATPIHITEVGDFTDGAVLGTLDVGVNIVVGQVGPDPDTADLFGLVLPDGLAITRLTFAITDARAGASHGQFTTPVWPLFLLIGGVSSFTVPVSYDTPGVLAHSVYPPWALVPPPVGMERGLAAYDLRYEVVRVAPVPEPASMGLLGTALLAAGLLYRRRRPA